MTRTADDLRQKQALPLSLKIALTKDRIRQWVNEFGENGVYVSFSGGKDSTVLLHIVRSMYPDIKAVFCDTGLEYPAIRAFVKDTDNVDVLKPKMNFKEVVRKYGYPVISKEIAGSAGEARKYIDKLAEYRQTDRQTEITLPFVWAIADFLGVPRRLDAKENREYRLLRKGIIPNERLVNAPQRLKMLFGKFEHKQNGVLTGEYSQLFDKSKYKYLLDAPFLVSDRCCKVMKKAPAHKYGRQTDRKPFTGQMADESRLRKSQWLLHGCNMFDVKYPISNPMSFWTEQDVLKYIHDNGIEIAKPYGEVIVKNTSGIDGQMNLLDILGDYRECQYETTKAKRTGCIFCMFGITQDKERFARLAEEEPKLYDYVMRGGEWNGENWQPSNDGLGYWFVIKWLNKAGKIGIVAPNIDKYEEMYGDDRTKAELQEGGNE